jgi:hypothetical protein
MRYVFSNYTDSGVALGEVGQGPSRLGPTGCSTTG